MRAKEEERQRAEKQRIHAEQEKARAVEAERQRIEAEKKAVEEAERKREANKRHVAKINNEVLSALKNLGLTEVDAKCVIKAIVTGEIPHTKISY